MLRLPHGGNLSEFKRAFPIAREPLIDLSTGINPHPYPVPTLDPRVYSRLPEPDDIAVLEATAAAAYGVPCADFVIAAAGSQALIQLLPHLRPAGAVKILGPTYAEHARAWSLAGHRVASVTDPCALESCDVAVLVNPNNPTGVLVPPSAITRLLDGSGAPGLVVIDEAFADLLDREVSCIGLCAHAPVVVLRSFGKTYGLAGLRLGFAIAAGALGRRLRHAVGPWAVSGPALAAGRLALSDGVWRNATRTRLALDGARLDRILTRAGFDVEGGTPLFRLARHPQAKAMFERLATAGIVVRAFAEHDDWLRFGIPGPEDAWARLADALEVA